MRKGEQEITSFIVGSEYQYFHKSCIRGQHFEHELFQALILKTVYDLLLYNTPTFSPTFFMYVFN